MGTPRHAVALAGSRLQAGPISDLYPASAIADQPRLLERTSGNGNPGPAHPKHHAHELMGHRKLVALNPVMRHQQPSGEAPVDIVAAIAGAGPRHLLEMRQHIAVQEWPQARDIVQCLPEGSRAHPQC
jgi:hypothetical protein